MERSFLPALVVPKDEYIPTYLRYVAELGHNDEKSYVAPSGATPELRDLLSTSVQVGRACELVGLGADSAADAKFAKSQRHLREFSGRLGDNQLDISRSALMLSSMVSVLRARGDPELVARNYATMNRRSLMDMVFYRERVRAFEARASTTGRSNLLGVAHAYSGLYVERVALSAITQSKGVFAMPSLPHHDRSKNSSESHDLVVIAKESVPAHINAEPGSFDPEEDFVLSKVQMKSCCLALCPTNRRVKGGSYNLRRFREIYGEDIVLFSAHCDIGEPGIGLNEVATLLDEQRRGVILDKEVLELMSTTWTFIGRMLVPKAIRMGGKRTANRSSTSSRR